MGEIEHLLFYLGFCVGIGEICFCTKFGTFWKPFSTKYGSFWHANFGVDPKLAETALLLYRVTDVPFLPKMEQEPKLVETVFYQYCGTFLIDPKLAETVSLFYRATDVPFVPKMEQEPKLVETVFYQLSNYWKSMLHWKLFIT